MCAEVCDRCARLIHGLTRSDRRVIIPCVLALLAVAGCQQNTGNGDTDGDGVSDRDDNCAAVANTARGDTDADGVGNACDNCPSSRNPNQEDANGNGIGDSCERATLASFAARATSGVIETAVDRNGRPTHVVGPNFEIGCVWSADLHVVDLTYQDDTGSFRQSVALELDQTSLLAALDDLEAGTGQRNSRLRMWLVAHPDVAAALAAMDGHVAKALTHQGQDANPEVEDYLSGLTLATAQLYIAYVSLHERLHTVDPVAQHDLYVEVYNLETGMFDTWRALSRLLDQQVDACSLCTTTCRVDDCRQFGACYHNPADPAVDCADELSFEDCSVFGGIWGGANTSCSDDNPLGACYYESQVSDHSVCIFTSEFECTQRHQGLFFHGSKCEDRTQGACCTTIWETENMPRDYQCRETFADDCIGDNDQFNPGIACDFVNGVSCQGTIAGIHFP